MNSNISSGNIFHARVVLESLLITHPKVFMTALTTQTNIKHLFKNALFRNLHIGNLNSFFLDLLCYLPVDGMEDVIACKIQLIELLQQWKFMPYLLDIATGTSNND